MQEATEWIRVAVPMAIALIARLGIETTDTAFLGHLGVSELASSALALVWVDFTFASIWKSYGATIKALCAQAVGAKNWDLAGAWLWIAIISSTIAIVPVAVAWLHTEDVLLGVGYAKTESEKAGLFNRWYVLSLPPMMWRICIQSYLQGRGDAMPSLVINLSLLAVNAGLNQLLIHGVPSLGFAGLGFIGSPVATSVTRWLSLLMVLAYAAWRGGKDGAAIFCGLRSPEAWTSSRWYELHVKRLLPLAAGSLVENAQLQIVSFLGARLGPHALAAHQVMLQLFFLLTSGLYGVVSATTIRVGYRLGAGQVSLAKFVAWLDLVVSLGVGLCISTVLLAVGWRLGLVFSRDEQVLQYIGVLTHLVSPAYLLLTVFFVSVAVLQGQARSLAIMAAYVPGAWGVTVPLAFVFVLVLHLGLEALWGALVAGYATVTLGAAYCVMTSDWEALSEAAVRRSSQKHGHAAGGGPGSNGVGGGATRAERAGDCFGGHAGGGGGLDGQGDRATAIRPLLEGYRGGSEGEGGVKLNAFESAGPADSPSVASPVDSQALLEGSSRTGGSPVGAAGGPIAGYIEEDGRIGSPRIEVSIQAGENAA